MYCITIRKQLRQYDHKGNHAAHVHVLISLNTFSSQLLYGSIYFTLSLISTLQLGMSKSIITMSGCPFWHANIRAVEPSCNIMTAGPQMLYRNIIIRYVHCTCTYCCHSTHAPFTPVSYLITGAYI